MQGAETYEFTSHGTEQKSLPSTPVPSTTMSLQQILGIIIGLSVLVGIPAMIAYSIWAEWGKKASDRPSHTSTAAAFLGALDRIVRPSTEHQIKEENRVVKEEDEAGEDKD